MPKTIPLLFLSAAIILASVLPGRAESVDPLANGRQHLNEGRFDEAYLAFYEAFKIAPDHPEVNFLLGRAAFESGRLEEAVMAYERVLAQNPEAVRVKLELGRTHFRLGSREMAKQYFKEVLATNPPEAVWQNIQKFLAAIDAAEQHHFVNGMFSVAVGYDDNVRTAPVSNNVPTAIGEVTLTGDTAVPNSNYIGNTTLLLNHIYRSEASSPWTWKSTFTNYNAVNETAHDLDINLFGLSSGPTWQNDKILLQGSLLLNHIDLGYERYLGIIGVNGTATYIYSQNILLTTGLTIQDKNFYQNGDKDSVNTAFNFGPIFVYDKNRVSLSAGYEKESAFNDLNNSYDRRSLTLRYDRQLPYDFNAYASLKRQESDYNEEEALFNKVREDKTTYFNLGLSRPLWSSADNRRNLIGQLNYARTDADSNIALYEYTKDVTTLALTLTF